MALLSVMEFILAHHIDFVDLAGLDNLAAPGDARHTGQHAFLRALRALLHRSLIQQHETNFGVQNLILENARQRLVDEIYQELTAALPTNLSACHPVTLSNLNRHVLRKAQAKEHIRIGQERLLLAPLLHRLLQCWGEELYMRRKAF